VNEILQDLSAAAILKAMDANPSVLFSRFERWPRAEVHAQPDLLWTLCDVPFALFNSVLCARLAPGEADAAIERAMARCQARGVPMLWWTGPTSTPADLGARLLAHGFGDVGPVRGMALDLRELADDRPAPPGLAVVEVAEQAKLRAWCETMICAFGFDELEPEVCCELFDSLGYAGAAPLRHFLATLDGEAVATSSLVLGGGVAGIYFVATRQAARRCGVGREITLAPLRAARALGYRVAVLQASALGAGVYRRLGFRDWCGIGQYVWGPG
jgi:hypothetical protein